MPDLDVPPASDEPPVLDEGSGAARHSVLDEAARNSVFDEAAGHSVCDEAARHPVLGEGDNEDDEGNGNARSEERAAFAWAFGPLRAGAASKLLRGLDEDLVDDLRKDYQAAKEWLQAGVRAANGGAPRKKSLRATQQVRNSMVVRIAIGKAFVEHKKEAQKQGDRHFVKSFVQENFTCAYTIEVAKRVRDCGKLVATGASVFTGVRGQVRCQRCTQRIGKPSRGDSPCRAPRLFAHRGQFVVKSSWGLFRRLETICGVVGLGRVSVHLGGV